MKTVAIVGYGVVGKAYHKVFPEAVIYDPYQPEGKDTTKEQVNACDVALVAVFTPHNEDGTLDISIVEEVIDWIECPLIVIKSALQPGTTDKLVAKTGKRIAVSVEYVGEGNYPVHFWKYPHQEDPRYHQMLVVGGEEDVAEEASQIFWRRLSPDIKIHKIKAREAEIVKLLENAYGALKVGAMGTFLSLAVKSNSSWINIHQAWNSDPRTDSMHVRAVEHERGWKSKCWDKDIPAAIAYAKEVGADDFVILFEAVLKINEMHLAENKD